MFKLDFKKKFYDKDFLIEYLTNENTPISELIDICKIDGFSINTKLLIGKYVFPNSLIKNFDSCDNLFNRKNIIIRVFISAYFKNLKGLNFSIKILNYFSVSSDDIFCQLKNKIQNIIENSECISEEKITVPGFEEYIKASKCNTLDEAKELYLISLEKGYPRTAFELSKIEPSNKIMYLNLAFENGMLTALDFFPKAEITKEMLKKRGDLGDPIGYYKLAKIYQKENNFDEAIINYKKSMPFFGYTELVKLNQIEKNDNSLENFFTDLIDNISFFNN